jgi:hypothetical protein
LGCRISTTKQNGRGNDTVRYIIVGGTDVEEGIGTIADSVATMPRTTVSQSKIGGVVGTSKLDLSGTAVVAPTGGAGDIVNRANNLSDLADIPMARTNLGISTEVGKIEWWPTTVVQSGRLKANGQSVSRTTYAVLLSYLVRSGAATFTNGSANVGMTAHDLSVGDPVKLFTAGTLPTNFTAGTHGLPSAGTNYFVESVVDANTVTLSTTVDDTAIVAGSAGSGSHTWVNAPHGDGDGSTTFTVPDLRGNFVHGRNDDGSVDANRTIGDVQLDAMQGHIHQESTGVLYLHLRAGAGIGELASGADYDRAMQLSSEVQFRMTLTDTSHGFGNSTAQRISDGDNSVFGVGAETRH